MSTLKVVISKTRQNKLIIEETQNVALMAERNGVNITNDIRARLEPLARKEQRSVSQMVRILLVEAMEHRESPGTITPPDVLRSLDGYEALELAEISESALNLLRQKLSTLVGASTDEQTRAGKIALKCLRAVAKSQVPSEPDLIKLGAELDINPSVLRTKLTQLKELLLNGT